MCCKTFLIRTLRTTLLGSENYKIRTEYLHLLQQVHLVVLGKNEQYEEDMIDVLQRLHPYVPGHSDTDANKKRIKVLSGGDYLTFKRHKEAQSAMQDERTPSTRLEGLIPKTEDFNTQAEWVKVSGDVE